MHRFRNKTNRLLEVAQSWKGATWTVCLDVNSRQSITGATAKCTRDAGGGIITTGHAYVDVAPFDDLADVLRAVLVDSALNAVDELFEWEEPELPFGPPAS